MIAPPFNGRTLRKTAIISKYQFQSAMGLGRVKTLCRKGEDGRELAFSGFDYARIAAISGWMPMIFITRVRL
jgi:hypothetical protein